MRENFRKVAGVLLALVLAVSLCGCAAPKDGSSIQEESADSCAEPPSEPEPEPEPEEPKTPVERILNSYYQDKHPTIKNDDRIDLPGPVVGRVAPWYSTETGDRETLEVLLEKLRNGERLSDNLTPEAVIAGPAIYETWGEALVYGEDGEICGHAQVSLVTGEILGAMDYREPNEDFFPDFYRDDFRWPDLLETAIAEGELDPDTAKLVACNFAGFATGAVLYDDSREYFIPTNRTALHRVDFEVGTLYPVPELAEMLQNNIETLFGYPPMNLGAKG